MSHKKTSSHFFIVISMVAALAGILFGYDTGVISGAILFISEQFSLTSQANGIIVSSVLLGAVLGALVSGRVTDRFGSKHLLIAVSLLFILASLASALATTVSELIAGRLLVGVAIGIASYTAPVYISEIAPPEHRGALVSLNQLAIALGILISYCVDHSLAIHFSKTTAWRWMLGLGAVPAIPLFLGMLCLPYSPRWVMAQGHPQKALSALKRIRGKHADVDTEWADIQASLQWQSNDWKMLFQPKVRAAFWVASSLAIIQQVTGINTLLYYAPTILTLTGFSALNDALMQGIYIGVVFVVFTLVALPLIDRWGRRKLLLLGLAGMSLSLSVLSKFFQNIYALTDQQHWIALAAILVYIACFAFSLGPVMWLMIAEIFPVRIRGLGSSLATAVNWGANMIVALTFLTLVESIGASRTFGLYALVGGFSWFFIYLFIPETKGLTLEKIEKNLHKGVPMRDLGTE